MKEEDEIMLLRQHAPEFVRLTVELARDADDASVRKEAIRSVAHREYD